MASTYTTSLGTVSFIATTDSWAEPNKTDYDVIGFPGGDSVAISISGRRETRRTFKALFASVALYRTMFGQRAGADAGSPQTGFLFVENWDTSPVNALLVGIQPDAPQVDGQVFARLEFVLY